MRAASNDAAGECFTVNRYRRQDCQQPANIAAEPFGFPLENGAARLPAFSPCARRLMPQAIDYRAPRLAVQTHR
jgi:hypothetical protein